MKKTILIITILAMLIVAGCTQTTGNDDELLIVASSFPLYEFAKEIAPQENVQMLVPPGTDIHHYDLRPSDLLRLDQAHLIIFIGEEMEPWLDKVLELEGKHTNKTIQATKKVQLMKTDHDLEEIHEEDEFEEDYEDEHELVEKPELDEEHDHESEYDPHAWLDFDNSIEVVNAITLKLSQIKPERSEEYRKNADNYIIKLRDLHSNYQTGLENCEIREFITNHDSFGYLAQKYNLKQIPIRGLSAEQEPSPRTIEQIIREAREHDIKHVFFEELASPRVSEAIAQEIGAETLMLSPGANIPAKDWGKKTFIDLMNENLENLKTGLRCN